MTLLRGEYLRTVNAGEHQIQSTHPRNHPRFTKCKSDSNSATPRVSTTNQFRGPGLTLHSPSPTQPGVCTASRSEDVLLPTHSLTSQPTSSSDKRSVRLCSPRHTGTSCTCCGQSGTAQANSGAGVPGCVLCSKACITTRSIDIVMRGRADEWVDEMMCVGR